MTTVYSLLARIWMFFGTPPEAALPAAQAWVDSMVKTGVSMTSLYLMLMYGAGAMASLPLAEAWARQNTWAFVLAQFIVPFLTAHKAANLYTTPPTTGDKSPPPK
jgi:hypothetical protein